MDLTIPDDGPSPVSIHCHHVPTTAVLGACDRGLALAGHLAQGGAQVQLWNRTPGPLHAIKALGGIQLNDQLVHPKMVTSSLADVLANVDVVLVTVLPSGQQELARQVAPHLADGQIILLVPGATGGALAFRHELMAAGCKAQVIVGEMQVNPLTCRPTGPGMATILGIAQHVPVAVLPAGESEQVVDRCLALLPMLVPAASVLETSLGNIGAILQPVITLLNASRLGQEAQSFKFYSEGITPEVEAMLGAADAERCAVAAAYGVKALPIQVWLAEAYDLPKTGLRQCLMSNPAYHEVLAPTGLRHRFVEEDVPFGLVPMVELGRLAGVPCPVLESLIELASVLNGRDYQAEGRTMAGLGITGGLPGDLWRLALGA
jgi:opine dehydrogenase